MQPATVTGTGLRNLSLSIKPPWVRRGQEAQLHCQYEMEGAPLYSVKWYRGTLEFYRYSPFENPPAKIFPFTGIKVDVSLEQFGGRGDRGGGLRTDMTEVRIPFGPLPCTLRYTLRYVTPYAGLFILSRVHSSHGSQKCSPRSHEVVEPKKKQFRYPYIT
uniref:Ig-like domain-containing protein n=1 Tax=Anopheles culicifacies TaxID=139723 RepID=A0A182M382_9DIPT